MNALAFYVALAWTASVLNLVLAAMNWRTDRRYAWVRVVLAIVMATLGFAAMNWSAA